MGRSAAFVLAPLALLGATAATPARPPDGTYTYVASGPIAFTTSVVLVTKNGRLATIEHPAIPGIDAVVETDYDAATLLPAAFRATQNGQSVDVAFSNGTATLSQPPLTRSKLPGTTGLMVSDGLAAYRLMMPFVIAANGAPISDFGLNGGAVVLKIDKAPADDARAAGVPSDDVESAFVDGMGVRMTAWVNPQTHVVDPMSASGVTFRLTGRTDDTTAATPAPEAALPTPYPLPSANYTSREITFGSTGATLSGTLSVPNAAGKRVPVVIMVHGSGPETRDGGLPVNPTFSDLANALSNGGFAVLRYDKRGIGKSTGNATENWHVLVDDVRAAAAFVRMQPEIDPNRIVLLGHSEGGLIVPLAAPNVPGLAGIVLMAAPAIPMSEIIKQQSARASPELLRAINAQFKPYEGVDPAKVIAKVNVPILILQGGRDMQVLPQDLPRLVDAARAAHRNLTVDVFPQDDHLFLVLKPSQSGDGSEYGIAAPLDPRVDNAVVTWLNATQR